MLVRSRQVARKKMRAAIAASWRRVRDTGTAAEPRVGGEPKADPPPTRVQREAWQERLRRVERRIAEARDQVDSTQRAADAARRQALIVPSGRALAKQAEASDAVATAERKLKAALESDADLRDEARRASVPPGWLR